MIKCLGAQLQKLRRLILSLKLCEVVLVYKSSKTLEQIGSEYLFQSQILKNYAEKLKASEKNCKCEKEKLRIRRRLCAIYADYATLFVHGSYLTNYYLKKE